MRVPGTEVAGGCESPNVDPGNRVPVLCKSSKYSVFELSLSPFDGILNNVL